MKFRLENIGVIRFAELEMGKLTILSGMNNSGKTYVTYAVYGFLYFWKNIFRISIDNGIIKKLRDTGVYNLQANQYAENASQIIEQACREYTEQLASVFSAQKNKFENAVFLIDISSDEIKITEDEHKGGIKSSNTKTGLTYTKGLKKEDVVFTLFSEENEVLEIPDYVISQTISHAIKSIVFGSVFPNPFIASAERTGAAIFRRELNFARNKILETISKKDSEIDPLFLLKKSKSDYAWPVDHNVDFTRNLEDIFKSESDISVNHKSILVTFADILGGDYQVTDKDELFFAPSNKTTKKIRLTMDESSSSVRSLLDIGFYLKHVAQNGDLLMIDEPELNLHPNNQRKMARLLASLVNCGLKIFITTHSDYILRELNNLILLNGDAPHLTQIAQREGYAKIELLKSADAKIYVAQESIEMLPERQRKTKLQTIVPIPVDDEMGIRFSSFDEAINEMNRIFDDIMFGG